MRRRPWDPSPSLEGLETLKTTLIPLPSAEPPVEDDLKTWARELILVPAVTPQELHIRFVVSDLLAQMEAVQ
jgi:hypothetical protein